MILATEPIVLCNALSPHLFFRESISELCQGIRETETEQFC